MTEKSKMIDPATISSEDLYKLTVAARIRELEGAIEAARIAHAEELANTRAAHAGQLATYRTKLVLSEARARDAEDRCGIAESKAVALLQKLDEVAHRARGIAETAEDTGEVHRAAAEVAAVPVRPLQRTTVRETTTREVVEEMVPTVGDILASADRQRHQPGARGFGFLHREMEPESADVVARIGGRRSAAEIAREAVVLLGHMVAGTRPSEARGRA